MTAATVESRGVSLLPAYRVLTDTPEEHTEIGPLIEADAWHLHRMWSYVEPTITCWLWRGPLDDDGYGRHVGRGAHLVVFERMVGKVPPGLQLDHLCFNRACVNPGHLEIVTPKENCQRAAARRRRLTDGLKPIPPRVATPLVCRNGHDLTVEGATAPRADGSRRCLECRRQSELRRSPRDRSGRRSRAAKPS